MLVLGQGLPCSSTSSKLQPQQEAISNQLVAPMALSNTQRMILTGIVVGVTIGLVVGGIGAWLGLSAGVRGGLTGGLVVVGLQAMRRWQRRNEGT